MVALIALARPSKHNEVAKPLGSTSDPAGATSPASPGGAALVPGTKAGTTVIVTLNDNSLDVANPDQVPPGPAVFTITNVSKTNAHNLFVDGPGESIDLVIKPPRAPAPSSTTGTR